MIKTDIFNIFDTCGRLVVIGGAGILFVDET
jgi:hypothetical protein